MNMHTGSPGRCRCAIAPPGWLGVAAGVILLVAAAGAIAEVGLQDGSAVRWDLEGSPLDPALHQRVVHVLESYYDFEFDEALATALAIRNASPDDALGHFLMAEIYWLQIVNNPERPELRAGFEAASRQVVELSERVLKRDERDSMALFFLGGVQGRRAILAGMESRHLETVQLALEARKYIKRLHKYHRDAEDAYFGLGLYDYYAAQLPWFGRVMGRLLLGLNGDAEQGVAQLERAAQHGLFTQVEARLFLAIIYLDTAKRYDDAIRILTELHDQFPGNLDFYGMLGHAYRTQHDYVSAIRVLEELVNRAEGNPVFGDRSRGLASYFLGSTYKVAGRFASALEPLDRAIALADEQHSDWLLISSLLERGRVHDLLGLRDEALADYEQVLALRDYRGSHDKVEQLVDRPYVAPPEETRYYLPVTQDGQSDSDPEMQSELAPEESASGARSEGGAPTAGADLQ